MADNNRNCDMLLSRIFDASFAMDDIILYLDTHPDDRQALDYYHYVVDLRKNAMEAYKAQCGPLMLDEVRSEDYWTWIEDPWPWEGVCG